ncbi:PKD domain-containing protein [Kribbella sp. NPDC051770]|uniref:PKD domain-containing protein n=1 Tax=Kribbella sp. NPDC051770 TaxID=3155413 RepID=UPI0034310936
MDAETQRLIDRRLNEGICGPRRPDGTVEGPARCDDWVPKNRPTVEDAVDQVRTQIRTQQVSVRFPQLKVKVQPAGRTLVNLDTIVYTDANTLSSSNVSVLGYPVVIEGTPVSYTWNFGDGSAPVTTRTPGKPYPAKEVTHKYMKRGSVSLTVTTNYRARFSVGGAGWQPIDGTVAVTGPATSLQVREAVPVLVEPTG